MAKGKREAPRKAVDETAGEAENVVKKRRFPWFYRIYLFLLILAAAAIVLLCYKVRDLLAEYEGAQPKYVAAQAFESYFAPINYDKLLADASYDAGVADDRAVREYLAGEIGEEELSWAAGSSGDPSELRYIIKAGRKQIGAIGLTLSEKTTEHGFQTYEFSYVELALDPAAIPGAIITISAPANCTVTVDGLALTEEHQVGSYLDEKAMKHYLPGVTGLDYIVYQVPGLTALPEEVLVSDGAGGVAEVTFDPETNSYTAGPAYSEVLEEEFGQFVIDAVEHYAAFAQRVPGPTLTSLKQYYDANTDLYRTMVIVAADLWIIAVPSKNEFTNVEIGEFYAHSEDVISGHISFTQTLYRGNEDRFDIIDMYVFLHRTNNGWRIYQWYNDR